MLSFECIKNEKSVYFLLTSAFRAFPRSISRLMGRWLWNGPIHPIILFPVGARAMVVSYMSNDTVILAKRGEFSRKWRMNLGREVD